MYLDLCTFVDYFVLVELIQSIHDLVEIKDPFNMLPLKSYTSKYCFGTKQVSTF